MTLNVRRNFEGFFLFINECTDYFKNVFFILKYYFIKKVLALNAATPMFAISFLALHVN